MGQQANTALPDGFQIEGYTIIRQISIGGFSIVYLAKDPSGQNVALKEYLPNSLALRRRGEITPIIKPEYQDSFRYGLKCFFEEGRALARLSHPNVVRVFNFFRANETVYMVMQYEQGRTLQEFIKKHKGHISERFLRGIFVRLLNGLRVVHSNKLLHLDLKPSNIYLRQDNTPVLIDFGAVRQVLHTDSPVLKPMYTPGFASPEHYGDRKNFGPWSDIYSIGASLYTCLAGSPPPPADERQTRDTMQLAAKRWEGKHSEHFLNAIDDCLKLNHLLRPQSAYSLQKMLAESTELSDISVPPEKSVWDGKRLELGQKFEKILKRIKSPTP
ncbi:MAG: serine/threonine protein kinase [Zoogloeaceae bacterium]|jgi:serine/threonine protein kinase|nr:serine/threonine protein kinase [Zoogloeaceae bacterium]